MMISFYESILLVLSQLAIIILTGCCVILFKRKCKKWKILGVGILLLGNVVLYVVMQLDSHITNADSKINIEVSAVILLLLTLMSLAFGVGALLSETINRKTINHGSIKESFDNLPTGVCFFNETGLPMLCNSAMHRFCFDVCDKDVQFITDLEECLSEDFVPKNGTIKDKEVFVLPDQTAWHLEKKNIIHKSGNVYTQYVATNVTELHKNRVQLVRENVQLRKVQDELKKLSANVVTVTREEEILNTKIRVHDEMGKCLLTAQKYLKEESYGSIPNDFITSWQRAVSMLKYNNDIQDEDMLMQIRKTCESVNMAFVQKGQLPKEEGAAYILSCAIRECVTNAVRYAEANELYADISETETEATVIVHNNGKIPEKEIVEGGGLSTLRRRVERSGGTMYVQSFPKFKLTVTVPKERRV